MKYEEIPSEDRYKYTVVCDCCSMPTTVMTQEDRMPEYHTWIYVQCACGEYLKFDLPVN